MTAQRKLKRKLHGGERPNLRLVPSQRPKRRRRWGRIRKPKFTPELLAYEEDIVFDAIVQMGGRITLERMMTHWPGRFRKRELWWVLVRLRAQGRVQTTMGWRDLYEHSRGDIYDRHGWTFTRHAKAWFERHKPQPHREFWL